MLEKESIKKPNINIEHQLSSSIDIQSPPLIASIVQSSSLTDISKPIKRNCRGHPKNIYSTSKLQRKRTHEERNDLEITNVCMYVNNKCKQKNIVVFLVYENRSLLDKTKSLIETVCDKVDHEIEENKALRFFCVLDSNFYVDDVCINKFHYIVEQNSNYTPINLFFNY